MGKNKYKEDIEKLFKKSPVVSYSSISRIINYKSKNKRYAKRIINYLIKKKLIKSITKGYYTTKDNASLLVLCFQPAYLGLQDALSFHNLWEQETIPIIITSKNIRSGIRSSLGSNIFIRNINEKYFFGIEYYQQSNIALPYSDIEKTFIDMIYYKEKMSKEVLNNFKDKINRKKLDKYLKVYPKRIKQLVKNPLRSS